MNILEYLLINALTVTVLAVVAWPLLRWLRKPRLAHVVWVLLLVKLVTPPLVQLPIQFGSVEVAAKPTADSALSQQTIVLTESTERGASDALQQTTSVNQAAPAIPGNLEAKSVVPRNRLITFLVTVWVVGGLAYLTTLLYRQVRFWKYLRENELIDVDLVGEGYDLAWQMGLANPPLVRILCSAVSPMLCGLGRSVTLIIPAELADRLSKESRATLIAHELAHYQRRDHWVRVLEGVVTTLFWWNPAVWLIRRSLHVAEEECVDARVVSEFPSRPRQYAEALLDTIDFMSERRVVLPPMASGLGSAPLLRHRLTRIMDGSVQQDAAPNASRRTAFCCVAMLVLPFGVGWSAQVVPTISKTKTGSVVPSVSNESFESRHEVLSPRREFRLLCNTNQTCRVLSADGSMLAEVTNASSAVFISNETVVIGTTSGQLQAVNCSMGSIHTVREVGSGVRSLDWSNAAERLAVVTFDNRLLVLDDALSIVASRIFKDIEIGVARFHESGQSLLLPTTETFESTITYADGSEAIEVSQVYGFEVLERPGLLSIESCELTTPIAFARFVGDQGEVVGYDESGRVTLFTPSPLTPIKVDWLPQSAIAALQFSPQVNDTQYVPESF